jgi:hypothetical protein
VRRDTAAEGPKDPELFVASGGMAKRGTIWQFSWIGIAGLAVLPSS